jgi:hypothetical protein
MLVLLPDEPGDFDLLPLLEPLADKVKVQRRAGSTPADVVLTFSESVAQLEARLPRARTQVTTSGAIWVLWPKKSSERFKSGARDLTEDVIRAYALMGGLVDVKVCAVDQTWSGLKLVRRLADR